MLSRMSLCINHRVIPKTWIISQKLIHQSMHISHEIGNVTIKINNNHKISRYTPALCSSFIRSISSNGSSSSANLFDINTSSLTTDNIVQNIPVNEVPPNLINSIPDVPLPPAPGVLDPVASLAEPTFQSLGLGSWTPVGIIQQLFELLHISCDLPWWTTITIATIGVRLLLFPFVILQQRNAAVLHNTLPGMQRIQNKLSEARTSGDAFEASRYTSELMQYMKDNNCSPVKSMIVPLVQAPIFISFFYGLRSMCTLPVESMRHGGLFWFTDLTVTDPYYLLPLITSGTLFITLRLGIDGPRLNSMGMIRYVVQAIPLIILPFTINFQSAIVWYWVSTNIISLIQVAFLRVPKVREYFKIPIQVIHPKAALNEPKKFKEGFKESWTNMKLAREMTDRQQLDTIQFNKAGRGPIPKTYAYNPVQDQLKKARMVGKK